MKKWLSLVLCLSLVMALVCTGCSKMSFSDQAEMEAYLADPYWVNDKGDSYIVCWYYDGAVTTVKFEKSPTQSLEMMFDDILNTLVENGEDTSFSTLVALITSGADGIDRSTVDVEMDPKKATLTTTGSQLSSSVYEFRKNETMVHNEEVYTKSDLSEVTDAFSAAMETLAAKKKGAFLQEHEGLAEAQDVKYSPYKYYGQRFILEGTAELDDYYNYEYRDMDMLYFCIQVTPTGGSVLDSWYIYGMYGQHDDLLERLKEGSVNIALVAEGLFYDALANEMANLVDYCIV